MSGISTTNPALAPAAFGRVMVDVDGILFPFTRAFSSQLEGEPFEEDDCPAWRIYPREVAEQDRLAAMSYAHSREAILRFGLYPGALEGMRRLTASGLEIHIVTRRSNASAAPSAQALAELGLRWDSYTAGPDLDKSAWCLEHEVGIVVDDKPATMIACAQAGLEVLSLRWTYNAGLAAERRIQLAGDWQELSARIIATATRSRA